MSDSSKTHTPQSSIGSQNEQTFTILPHPAKSNNPADLTDPRTSFAGSGLNPAILAHHGHGPHVPSQEMLNKLDVPLSKEELKKRSEVLNK